MLLFLAENYVSGWYFHFLLRGVRFEVNVEQ
jgi:hypothetical protein